MKAVHVFVEGRVQGVYFRESTKAKAQEFAVAGWVRNCPDGRVEAVIEGPDAAVDQLLAWMHTGPPNAAVGGLHAESVEPTGARAFEVLR